MSIPTRSMRKLESTAWEIVHGQQEGERRHWTQFGILIFFYRALCIYTQQSSLQRSLAWALGFLAKNVSTRSDQDITLLLENLEHDTVAARRRELRQDMRQHTHGGLATSHDAFHFFLGIHAICVVSGIHSFVTSHFPWSYIALDGDLSWDPTIPGYDI